MNCVSSSAVIIALSGRPISRAVDRRHPDHRLDAVVVEQEREQEHERVPIAAQLAETSPSAAARRRRTRCRRDVRPASIRTAARARCGTAGSRRPPTRRRRWRAPAASPCPHRGCRTSSGFWIIIRLMASSDAAAHVADGVAGRRHAIEVLVRHEVGQQRLVEHDAAGDADIADHEQHQRQLPVAALDPEHRRRRRGADADEHREQPLLDRRCNRRWRRAPAR